MIPKKIFYFWFGGANKNNLLNKCMRSWNIHLANYDIVEWNEDNFDVNSHSFTQKAFKEKRWAFLSDYARLDVLYRKGGIYLDTDMEVLKPLDEFLDHGLFLGMESDEHVNASILGCVPGHWFVKEVLDEYDTLTEYKPIPVILTEVLSRHTQIKDKLQYYKDIAIYPSEYFYPVAFGEPFNSQKITSNTYTIHWWDHSWGSKKVRALKWLGLFNIAVFLKNKFF